ncbi:MAG: hypothetical protein ABIG61_15105 [Planctomycetota bacterium]
MADGPLPADPRGKKLIGWLCTPDQSAGTPSPDYINIYIGQMQHLEFDGLILGIYPGGYFLQDDFFTTRVILPIAFDEYFWVYSGNARFWPSNRNVHPAYEYALARSRQKGTLTAHDWNQLELSNPDGPTQTWASDIWGSQVGIDRGLVASVESMGGHLNGAGMVRFSFPAMEAGASKGLGKAWQMP